MHTNAGLVVELEPRRTPSFNGEVLKKLYRSCPICASNISRWATKSTANSVYHIDHCITCGYAFVNPRPSFEFLMSYYESFGLGEACAEAGSPTLDSIMRNEVQDPNSTIDARRILTTIERLAVAKQLRKFLDVGCGYGFFSKEALIHGFEVIALEVAKNDRSIAEQMTALTPVDTSFEEFEQSAGSLSVILMSQILEHALDVNQWVEKANILLESGGILAIALPNFGSLSRILMQEREPYICPPAHLNFFNPRSLETLLVRHGFKVDEVQWVSRIPSASFQKRLPKPAKPLLPLLKRMSLATLRIVDSLRLGVMINVYARKTHDSNHSASRSTVHQAELLHGAATAEQTP